MPARRKGFQVTPRWEWMFSVAKSLYGWMTFRQGKIGVIMQNSLSSSELKLVEEQDDTKGMLLGGALPL